MYCYYLYLIFVLLNTKNKITREQKCMKRREESEDTEKKGEIRENETRAPIHQNYIFLLLFSSLPLSSLHYKSLPFSSLLFITSLFSSPLFLSLHFTRAFLYLNEQILNSACSLSTKFY